MRDFPSPERGVSCILIFDIISKSVLVLFSLLRGRNYHYNKGPLKFEFIKCKTIHRRLLLIVVLQSISLRRVIEIVLFLFSWDRTTKRYIMCYCTFTYNDSIILDMFLLNCHGTLIFSQILNLRYLEYFCHNFWSSQINP